MNDFNKYTNNKSKRDYDAFISSITGLAVLLLYEKIIKPGEEGSLPIGNYKLMQKQKIFDQIFLNIQNG